MHVTQSIPSLIMLLLCSMAQGPSAAELQARFAIYHGSGSTLRVDGVASTVPAGAYVARYAWDFGDGSMIAGQTQLRDHRYASAGRYRIELVITDDSGRQSRRSRQVEVAESGSVTGSDGPIPTLSCCESGVHPIDSSAHIEHAE